MPKPLDDVLPGQAAPIGATVRDGGVNFSVYSKHATQLELLLFDAPEAPLPSRTIQLTAQRHSTHYWHVFVKGLGAGQLYAFRAHGPQQPAQGLRFDSSKVLLDPYARAVWDGNYQREAAQREGDNCAQALRGVVVDSEAYDWEGDTPLKRSTAGSVIYELHVGGFTRHQSSGVAPERRGTYAGLIEKIPYLKELGITAVELLPVQQFDAADAPTGRQNYWGYSPLAFFAPHRGYCTHPGSDPLAPVREFRDLVKALHRAGIEVILDVVFNHTTEGDEKGPTLSLRGLDNRGYYILSGSDRSRYENYSGCGNTLNAHRSVVRRMILDCLRYWVESMHVDGFRFDLASVMSRDSEGVPLKEPPILWDIETDPVLVGTKLIAEAWDAGGLYQVGSFAGDRWAEWNGPFRDDVRRFIAGIGESTSGQVALRVSGSRDLYQQRDREPSRCINFITCHDGFTLRDLVTYERKHNEDNGESNRDGSDTNWSWNCGAEGPSDAAEIESLRLRQMKNLLVTLFTSQGTPMLQMGDEVCRTQRGNNNVYCQDNELAWFNWNDVKQQASLLRFVRGLIRLNTGVQLFHEGLYWSEPGGTEILWHGVQLEQPDWSADSHSLAFELVNPQSGEHLYVMLNCHREPLSFALPVLPPTQRFHRIVDTGLSAPADFTEPTEAPVVEPGAYRVGDHSAVVLLAR